VVQDVPEHLIHEILEYGGGDDQAKQHHALLIVASRSHKTCLPLFPHTYQDEVINTPEVQISENPKHPRVVPDLLGRGKVDNRILL